MIVLLHAYSRSNLGDGLLVDLSLDRLKRAGVPPSSVVVVALDPRSFGDLPRAVGFGTADRAADLRTLAAAASSVSLVRGRMGSPAASAIAEADAFIAVGGGYLRAGTRTNRIGTAINHLPQLLAAERSGKPVVYLPQSVGPLQGWVGRRVRRGLGSVAQVHVRDDRSLAELGNAPNVRRTPDLAVLAVAEQLAGVQTRDLDAAPVLVARALPRSADYSARLMELGRRLPDCRWGVQAEGAASKSDRTFYDALGITSAGSLGELVHAGTGPVVSVRLHGAVQAILSGVPAIHLGYERKSWGAYEDLGLTNWLHSARHFDPAAVAEQVAQLRADPEPFWRAVHSRIDALREHSAQLDGSIKGELAG